MSLRRAIGLSLIITLAQLAFVLAFAPWGGGFPYLKLNNWDSQHYSDIASRGYHIPSRPMTSEDLHTDAANVVFFPGYPVLARNFGRLSGIPIEFSLLLVSQLAAWAFWAYFLLLLRERGVTEARALRCALLVASYPSAFFMMTGYSEGLFLAGLLGFFFWSDRAAGPGRNWAACVLAAIHGFGMTLTRIVGLFASAYPVIRLRRVSGAAIAAVSALGVVVFFAFLKSRFGMWDLYFKAEQIGWSTHPVYWAILDPRSYIPHFFFEDTIDSISRASVTAMAVLFIWIGRVEWHRGETSAWSRWGILFAAFSMFYIALSSKAPAKMDSMIRYTLPVFVLLVIALAEAGELPSGARGLRWRQAGLGFLWALQVWMVYRFTRGHWVA